MLKSKCCGKEVVTLSIDELYGCPKCMMPCDFEIVEEPEKVFCGYCHQPDCNSPIPLTESWQKEEINKILNMFCAAKKIPFIDTVDLGYNILALLSQAEARHKEALDLALARAEDMHEAEMEKMARDAGRISTITTGYSLEEELLTKYLKE